MKIRTRLTLQFFLLTASIFALALMFIYERFARHVESEFFTLLESKARMTAEMVLRHEDELQPLPPPGAPGTLPTVGNTAIFDSDLRCVFSVNTSAPLFSPETLRDVRSKGVWKFKHGENQVFGATVRAASGREYIVLSEDLPDNSKLHQLRNILMLSLLFIMAAVAGGGWFYAGQALQPVSRIVGEVDSILPTDLSRRLQTDNQHDELSHLVTTFNRLLDRIQEAFRMQRSFISNVSHELKNPLAAMDAQLQLVRNKHRTAEEYDRVLDSLHDDVHALTETAEKLLQLAKVHSDVANIVFSPIRLDELLYQTRDMLLKTHPEYTVRIEIRQLPDDEEQLCVQGNEALLRTALLNLFDNGCKFSPDHAVRVSIGFDAEGQPEIAVWNAGLGIPAADLPRVFDPFFRSSRHATQRGSGIGLSLVQSILRLHESTVEVRSSPEDGTCFRLRFPKNHLRLEPADMYPVVRAEMPGASNPPLSPAFSVKKVARAAMSLLLVMVVGLRCSPSERPVPQGFARAFEVLQDWNGLLLEMVRYSEGYRPPVSARMFAYMGLAAWESCLPVLPEAQSFEGKLAGLDLPEWEGSEPLLAEVALNAAYATLSERFFPHTPIPMRQKSRALAERHARPASLEGSAGRVEASRKFGESVAETVFRWSATDSIGHQAYLYNYDRNYHPPAGPGLWQPSANHPMPALLPAWGRARTFIVPASEFPTRPPVGFSEEHGSAFFAQALEVYSFSLPISDEKRWIAEFWSDDIPGVSLCAASRWISIARQALEKSQSGLSVALETYLKIGFVLNDTAIRVWREKYTSNIERPEGYIQRNIGSGWEPLHPSPPFPSYPSGHAAFGASAAAVLETLLGKSFALTDRTHEGRKEFLGMPRKFESFQAMARENAMSRLFIGVHYRMDSEEGLRLGALTGERIAALRVRGPFAGQ